MQANKNIPYYLVAAGLFIALKFCFTFAGNDNLIFLLKPTVKLVEFFTGSQSVYTVDNGYYYEKLNILIDKSCSGFNFWLLCFLLFTYLTVKYSGNHLHKIISIPAALLSAYLLTIFVNASRIFVSIVVQSQTKNSLPDQQHWIHETVGIITNLSFLVLAYFLVEKFLIHKQSHEKSA